jgi:hypothetical protein
MCPDFATPCRMFPNVTPPSSFPDFVSKMKKAMAVPRAKSSR